MGSKVSILITAQHHDLLQKMAGCTTGSFPKAEEMYKGVLSLPLFPTISRNQIGYVVDSLLNIV